MAARGFIRRHAGSLCLAIKLQPRASRNQVGEPLGDELKIRVTAPPVDSAANEALVRFLAEKLECPPNSVQLVRGHASRHKIVSVAGLSAEEILEKLLGPS